MELSNVASSPEENWLQTEIDTWVAETTGKDGHIPSGFISQRLDVWKNSNHDSRDISKLRDRVKAIIKKEYGDNSVSHFFNGISRLIFLKKDHVFLENLNKYEELLKGLDEAEEQIKEAYKSPEFCQDAETLMNLCINFKGHPIFHIQFIDEQFGKFKENWATISKEDSADDQEEFIINFFNALGDNFVKMYELILRLSKFSEQFNANSEEVLNELSDDDYNAFIYKCIGKEGNLEQLPKGDPDRAKEFFKEMFDNLDISETYRNHVINDILNWKYNDYQKEYPNSKDRKNEIDFKNEERKKITETIIKERAMNSYLMKECALDEFKGSLANLKHMRSGSTLFEEVPEIIKVKDEIWVKDEIERMKRSSDRDLAARAQPYLVNLDFVKDADRLLTDITELNSEIAKNPLTVFIKLQVILKSFKEKWAGQFITGDELSLIILKRAENDVLMKIFPLFKNLNILMNNVKTTRGQKEKLWQEIKKNMSSEEKIELKNKYKKAYQNKRKEKWLPFVSKILQLKFTENGTIEAYQEAKDRFIRDKITEARLDCSKLIESFFF